MSAPAPTTTSTDAASAPGPAPAVASEREGFVARLVGSKLFWLLAIGFLFFTPLVLSIRREMPPDLPVLGVVPELALRDEHGRAVTKADLRGHVTIVAFFFTGCTTVCPMLSARLGLVQHRLRNMGGLAQILSISVDPERDTPERLREYARGYHARPDVWRFATGDQAEIERVVVQGFRQALQRPTGHEGHVDAFDIVHGGHFVLVDPQARIRGYYDSNDATRVDDLVRDVGLVAPRTQR